MTIRLLSLHNKFSHQVNFDSNIGIRQAWEDEANFVDGGCTSAYVILLYKELFMHFVHQILNLQESSKQDVVFLSSQTSRKEIIAWKWSFCVFFLFIIIYITHTVVYIDCYTCLKFLSKIFWLPFRLIVPSSRIQD